MDTRKREQFKELCEQAEVQNDRKKLAKLTSRIYEILKSEVDKLKKRPAKPATPAPAK